jgi:hemoglobin-like flavoprotein
MQLFKKFKHKKPEVIIPIEIPIIEEVKPVIEEKVVEEVIPNYPDMMELFNKTHQNFVNGTKQIIRDYYIIKLFSYIAADTNKLREKINKLDLFYFEYMKDVESLKLRLDGIKEDIFIKETYLSTKKYILLLQNKKVQLCDFIFNIKADHYDNIKVATLGIVHNKSSEEIKKYYDDIADMIKAYKNIKEAAEYIYFNSTDDLNEAIGLFSRLASTKVKVDPNKATSIEYFKKYGFVLTLSMREWVELINNMKFALKTIGKIDEMKFDKAKRKYEILEKKCFILMLYFELVANDKSLKNFEMV